VRGYLRVAVQAVLGREEETVDYPLGVRQSARIAFPDSCAARAFTEKQAAGEGGRLMLPPCSALLASPSLPASLPGCILFVYSVYSSLPGTPNLTLKRLLSRVPTPYFTLETPVVDSSLLCTLNRHLLSCHP
jgi:hypothetical protein